MGFCLGSCSQGLLGGESSSWLTSGARRHPSGLLVGGDGSVCGVGAGGHPKRAQSWALSSHLAGMPLLTTRCSHHVVDLDRFGLALPVFASADKGGWASTDLLVHLQQCIGSFVPEVSFQSWAAIQKNLLTAFAYILNIGDIAAVSCMR